MECLLGLANFHGQCGGSQEDEMMPDDEGTLCVVECGGKVPPLAGRDTALSGGMAFFAAFRREKQAWRNLDCWSLLQLSGAELALREATHDFAIHWRTIASPLASRQQAACEKLEQAPAVQVHLLDAPQHGRG